MVSRAVIFMRSLEQRLSKNGEYRLSTSAEPIILQRLGRRNQESDLGFGTEPGGPIVQDKRS